MEPDMYYEEFEEDPFEADMQALLEEEIRQERGKLEPEPYAIKKLNFESPPANKPKPDAAPLAAAPVFTCPSESSPQAAGQFPPGVSREMPDGEFMCVSGDHGSYVYVTVDPAEEDGDFEVEAPRGRARHLLKTPLSELHTLAEAVRNRKAADWAKESAAPVRAAPAQPEPVESSLWVNKYEPKAFHELLSDNEINLEVLKWLKEWDGCVFDNKPEKRPWDKVLLLTGGPGVGKTTLAHVLANHAGYFPTEVNASMERTEKELKEHFISVTGQQTTIASKRNKDRRPICLIVDEIDGVASSRDQQSAIQMLVNMAKVQVGSKSKSEDMDEDGGPEAPRTKTARPKKGLPPLLRPVICICNNPYAPALRELKAVSKVWTVPDVSHKRMANRLKHISTQERLQFDRHALTDLCTLADGDIRSCLMTMQFLKRSGHGVTSKTIQESNVGIKDQVKALFPIWNDIFTKESNKSNYTKLMAKDAADPRQTAAQKQSVSQWKGDVGYLYNLRQIERHPEQDRLIEGCWEHYLKIKYADSDGRRTMLCSDWFAWADICADMAFKYQAHGLRKFLPFATVQAHLYCSAMRKPPRLEFPRSMTNNRNTTENHKGILRTLYDGLPVAIRPYNMVPTMVHDLLSDLLRILNPKMKINMTNMQILSAKDKADIKELTQKYVQYNIGYVGRTEGHQLLWKMDIELEQLLTFTGLTPSFTLLPAPFRQMLSREITFEKVRQAAYTNTKPEKPSVEEAKANLKKTAEAKAAEANKLRVENEQKVVKAVDKGAQRAAVKRDFFGRPIKAPVQGTNGADTTPSKKQKSHPIKFQFNEGFTNAIRRPVRLEDFL